MKLAILLALAATLSAGAEEYTNVVHRVNGTNRVFRIKLSNLGIDPRSFEKEHGRRTIIEKDPISGTVTWHYEDGFKFERKFPRKFINNPKRFANINPPENKKKTEEEAK